MDFLDDLFLPRSRNEFSAPYLPSIFLCCILIFWTTLAMVLEVIIPQLALAYTLTTYGPTTHFAVQSIIQTLRESHTDPERVKSTAKRAVILAWVWPLNIAAHFLFWWFEKTGWAGIFLNGVFPGSQSTLIMLYIALRYVLNRRASERRKRTQLAPGEDEAAANEAEVLPAEAPGLSTAEDAVGSAEVPVASNIYQPSIYLLATSLLLVIFTTVTDIKNNVWFHIDAAVQTYIPTSLVQLYILSRIMRGRAQSPQDLSTIAGFSFELTLAWVWTRLLIVALRGIPLYRAWLIPGIAETVLMLYFSVRYAYSLSNTSIQQYKMIPDRIEPDEVLTVESPLTEENADALNNVEMQALGVYHPSIVLLLVGIVLSGICIYIEAPTEPAIGGPMSVLVYLPAIGVYTYFIVQSWRYTYADLRQYDRATEWSIQIAAIWVLTHAFYLFVWPVSQYLKAKVMNPYVRCSAVGIAVYISSRYYVDRRLRARGNGVIALPPDDAESTSITTPGHSSAGSAV